MSYPKKYGANTRSYPKKYESYQKKWDSYPKKYESYAKKIREEYTSYPKTYDRNMKSYTKKSGGNTSRRIVVFEEIQEDIVRTNCSERNGIFSASFASFHS